MQNKHKINKSLFKIHNNEQMRNLSKNEKETIAVVGEVVDYFQSGSIRNF